MQNVELKALVPFKITLPMNWDILGTFSPIRCPNKINILKLEQLNHQIVFAFIMETSLDTRQEVEHFSLFLFFWLL